MALDSFVFKVHYGGRFDRSNDNRVPHLRDEIPSSTPSTRRTRKTKGNHKYVMKLPPNLPNYTENTEEADDYHSYCLGLSKLIIMLQQQLGHQEENASSSNSIQGGPSYGVNGDASRQEEYKTTIYQKHSSCNGDCFSHTNAELK
ncbi:hypothetical protein CJ030_MR1G012026 [Morella rubra]|uniref:Uncharacterized protein n=1 Tax=Morella rubra TaxID=262757 RepID=A0A6A1WMD1_9ROSI|nr:hypothetical protein CJ030_MR1G012026 [Morella rubra]